MDHFTSVLYNAHLGFDQRQLWNVIEKKIDSWAKDAPYRRLNVTVAAGSDSVDIGNLPREDSLWKSKEVLSETLQFPSH